MAIDGYSVEMKWIRILKYGSLVWCLMIDDWLVETGCHEFGIFPCIYIYIGFRWSSLNWLIGCHVLLNFIFPHNILGFDNHPLIDNFIFPLTLGFRLPSLNTFIFFQDGVAYITTHQLMSSLMLDPRSRTAPSLLRGAATSSAGPATPGGRREIRKGQKGPKSGCETWRRWRLFTCFKSKFRGFRWMSKVFKGFFCRRCSPVVWWFWDVFISCVNFDSMEKDVSWNIAESYEEKAGIDRSQVAPILIPWCFRSCHKISLRGFLCPCKLKPFSCKQGENEMKPLRSRWSFRDFIIDFIIESYGLVQGKLDVGHSLLFHRKNSW